MNTIPILYDVKRSRLELDEQESRASQAPNAVDCVSSRKPSISQEQSVPISAKQQGFLASCSNHIKSIVYGGVDGIITMFGRPLCSYVNGFSQPKSRYRLCFFCSFLGFVFFFLLFIHPAIVCSIDGGNISPQVLVVVGIATLIADAFSMALGDFLSSRAEQENEKMAEARLFTQSQEEQKRNLVNHFMSRNYGQEDAVQLVSMIARDQTTFRRIVVAVSEDEMATDASTNESTKQRPIIGALWTFAAFVGFGVIPLLVAFVSEFLVTVIFTGVTLCCLGILKVSK